MILVLILVLVLKDSSVTNFKSLSLSKVKVKYGQEGGYVVVYTSRRYCDFMIFFVISQLEHCRGRLVSSQRQRGRLVCMYLSAVCLSSLDVDQVSVTLAYYSRLWRQSAE